jgi:hypothetical protein
MRGTLPNGAHLWLHAKPLDAAIGQGKCPHHIAPAATMVEDFKKKRKNTNKTQLLPSFLMVDQCKKAIKSQDPPGTLYSRPWRD